MEIEEAFFEEEFSESSCFAREECIERLLVDLPADCLYCKLRDFDGEY